jgi:UDP-2-acetamido-2-deoxy-ribo-hexuluronate aminotransferase
MHRQLAFVDLQADYAAHKSEFDSALSSVCSRAAYILGQEVFDLERELGAFVGRKHCITVGNGTVALQIALLALGVGPGDEVITTPFTWISTPHAISLVCATPVFVDIDPVTFNLDARKLESAITSRTKAILAVSLFGQMPDFKAITVVASKYGLPVLEDAAQSFGATQAGM